MRPTGKLHLGNYMGALHNWVRLQDEYECFFFVADWHALTTDYADPSRIKQNTVDVALDFLAAGLKPEKCTIFIQSHVPQHAELHLLLSMITPLGWLERVPSYKDQQENIKGKDLTTYGFLGYPLLQSADILLYQPDYVPVGADQVAHVELTREVARRFNSLYKSNVFPEPGALLTPTPKLPGTDGRKMSKSYSNTILLSDSPMTVVSKLQGMSTNGQRLNQSDPGNPDLCPIGDLHKVFSAATVIEETQRGCRTASIRCEFCKIDAGRSVNAEIEPIHSSRMKLESNIDETWEMLLAQGEKASKRAEQTMVPVRSLFNVSRDLGSVRRRFSWTAVEQDKRRDLTNYEEWLTLRTELRAKQLRDYWRENILPFDVPLRQEANRNFKSIERELEEPLLTRKGKRVYVGSSRAATGENALVFDIPLRSYEVWVLLLWHGDKRLNDFVIPQKYFIGAYSAWKNYFADPSKLPFEDQNVFKAYGPGPGEVKVTVRIDAEGNKFTMRPTPFSRKDITELLADYGPLQ
jgi:tryptophanyl-tRNA synthetase